MNFFKPKSPQIQDSNQLRDLLLEAARKRDQRRFGELCKANQDLILKQFGEWAKVPEQVRNDPAAVRPYVETLMEVAQYFANILKRPELLQRLIGPDDSNPLRQWEKSLERARTEMEAMRYGEAAERLTRLLAEVSQMQGTGAQKFLPITYGYLGECYFQMGESSQALAPMQTALDLCEQYGDGEGIVSYLGNLYEIHRYLGDTGSAASCADRRAQTFEALGRRKEAAQLRKQAQLVRRGEPLNRVVLVDTNGESFEIDQASQIKTKGVRFNFERNRVSLRPAQALIHKGEQWGNNKNYGQALNAFQEAARADRFDPHARYLEGLTLIHLRRYAEAIESYQSTEKLAPGWFNCRADCWLAQQLAQQSMSYELFLTLQLLEDSAASPQDKIRLAEKALAHMGQFAPLFLFYGQNLAAVKRAKEAQAAYRTGLSFVAEPDVKTRLLLNLGVSLSSGPEKRRTLQDAVQLNGNLVAAAMAAFALAATGG